MLVLAAFRDFSSYWATVTKGRLILKMGSIVAYVYLGMGWFALSLRKFSGEWSINILIFAQIRFNFILNVN